MSNTLKADSAGFLIGGQPIKPSGAELALLRGVRDDVRAIRKMLEGAKKEAGAGRAKAANDEPKGVRGGSVSAKQVVATPSGRAGASSTTQKTVKTGSIDRVKDASEIRARTNKPVVIAMPVARGGNRSGNRSSGVEPAGVGRDSAGRFVGGSGSIDSTSKTMGLLSDIKDSIGNVVDLSGGDEVDPAIKAAHEIQGVAVAALSATKAVGSVVAPIGRSLFSKNTDTKLPFFRRIYAELRGLRREESTFNKAQLRTLNRIDGKESPTQGSGGLGMIGTMLMAALGPLMVLLTRIPVVGPILSKMASMVPALTLQKLPTSTAGGGLLSKTASGANGLLKRVPILGAALAAVGSGLGVYESETDSSLSRAEKDKKTGAAIGGGVGTIGGMMGGAAAGAALGALGGPIGIAIGGIVGGAAGAFFGEEAGKVIGETIGEWVTDLRAADIPGKISSAWTATTNTMSKTWDGGVSLFNAGMDKSSSLLSDAYTGLSEVLKNFGVDLPAAVQATMDAATALKDKAVGMASKAATAVKESAIGRGAAWVGDKVSSGWNDAKGYLVGASQKAGVDAGSVAKIAALESGYNPDAAPIGRDGKKMSSAHGYGQFLDGTWTDMLNKHGAKYGVAGAGKLTKDQADKFRGDKNLQASMLAEFTKENIEKGRKFGGKDDDANVYAFHNLGDGDAKKLLSGMNSGMSVRDALMQGATTEGEKKRVESVIANNKSIYGDGSGTAASAYGRMGDLMRRGDSFAKEARTAAGTPPVTAASPVNVTPVSVAAASAPKVEASVQAPRVPDMPTQSSTQSYSNSSVTQATPTVVVSGGKQMAGRDLSNRPIAHVATGGLSGSVG